MWFSLNQFDLSLCGLGSCVVHVSQCVRLFSFPRSVRLPALMVSYCVSFVAVIGLLLFSPSFLVVAVCNLPCGAFVYLGLIIEICTKFRSVN